MFSFQILKENAYIEKYINVFHLLPLLLLPVIWKTIHLPLNHLVITQRLQEWVMHIQRPLPLKFCMIRHKDPTFRSELFQAKISVS